MKMEKRFVTWSISAISNGFSSLAAAEEYALKMAASGGPCFVLEVRTVARKEEPPITLDRVKIDWNEAEKIYHRGSEK